jgi:histone H3/H4
MAGLPIAPVERIIRKAGADRISQEACEALASVMESYSIDLSERSVQLAKHAKRKTVRSDDVRLAARGFNE